MSVPQLRPYQLDLVERCRARVRQGVRRLVIQAPVGAGKTLVTSQIVRGAVERGRRVLFLAHRRRLIAQKAAKLEQFGVPHAVLMSGRPTSVALPVQVASRDTLLSRSVRNAWLRPPHADVVIVDEAHRVMSDEYQRLLALYPDAIHIGVTATPAREDGKGLGDFYQALECCAPLSQLIREGYICPVTCWAPQNYSKRVVSKRKLAGDPVETWLKLARGRPTVLFAPTVAASVAARDAFRLAGVTAEHLDAHTPDEERDAIIARVEARATEVLCNCNVMVEGVDVPCLSCCVLLRMAGSYVLFIQAVGRVMRSHPGKADALLIDHSDAVLEHGFPDEDVRWELSTSDTVERRNKEDREEGKRKRPVACPRCGLLYAGAAVCPGCGYRLPARLQPAAVRNQILTEVDKALAPDQRRAAQMKHWRSCLYVMARRNQTMAAASQMFRRRWHEWPPGDFPNVPRPWERQRKVAEVIPELAGRAS